MYIFSHSPSEVTTTPSPDPIPRKKCRKEARVLAKLAHWMPSTNWFRV